VLDVFDRCGERGLTFANRVSLAEELPFLDMGETGLYYISSFTLDAILYRSGIVSTLRFAGSVEMSNFKLTRFTQVIGFEESSITALDLFIQRMFSEKSEKSIINGEGEVFGIYREVPFVARERLIEIMDELREHDIRPIHAIGGLDELVCGVPPRGVNKIGFACIGPSTPIGILRAIGVPIRVHISHDIIDFSEFRGVDEVKKEV
jgi:repressor of nif and glnA expression